MTAVPKTIWGARAARVYTDAYAEDYRAHDDVEVPSQGLVRLSGWLRGVCDRFDRPIDALDLGCGTGRYFHAVTGVRHLTGIDVSRPMLARAERPAGQVSHDPSWLTLVEGDFLVHEFPAASFDLVYAIGVVGEHTPIDEALARRVRGWLRPAGRFAFTTVHPDSPSIPATFRRAIGRALAESGALPGAVRRRLHRRLMSGGLYADESRVREILDRCNFVAESIETADSDVHRHVLAVGVTPA